MHPTADDNHLDATAIHWIGLSGTGISGTKYEMWSGYSGSQRMMYGGLDGGHRNMIAGIIPKENEDTTILKSMLGRAELASASFGVSLRDAPVDLIRRGVEVLKAKIFTLEQQSSAESAPSHSDEKKLKLQIFEINSNLEKLETWASAAEAKTSTRFP